MLQHILVYFKANVYTAVTNIPLISTNIFRLRLSHYGDDNGDGNGDGNSDGDIGFNWQLGKISTLFDNNDDYMIYDIYQTLVYIWLCR